MAPINWELDVRLLSGERLTTLPVEPSSPASAVCDALQSSLPKKTSLKALLVHDGSCFNCRADSGTENDHVTVRDLEAAAGRGENADLPRMWQAVLGPALRPGSYSYCFDEVIDGVGPYGPQSTETRAIYKFTLSEDCRAITLVVQISGLVDHNPYMPMIVELYGVPRVDFEVTGRLTDSGDLVLDKPLPRGLQLQLGQLRGTSLSLKATVPIIKDAGQSRGGTEVRDINLESDKS